MSDEPKQPPDEAPRKRRPKDSEFFELPPDLKKKMAPGELPVMATSTPRTKPELEKKAGKGGCLGLLAALAAGGGFLVAALA